MRQVIIILGIFLVQKSASQVQLIQPYGGKDISVLLSSHVNFTWTFTGSFFNAAWGLKKSDNTDDIDLQLVSVYRDGTVTITDNGQYKNRVSGHWNGAGQVTFTLRSLKKEDERYFAVKITDSVNFIGVGDTVQIVVNARPSITPPVIKSHYTEGSPVSITCTAAGIPEPDVQWYRKNQLKGAGHKTALLTFNSIRRNDSGNYTCRANNSVGSTDEAVKIIVHYPASIKSHSPVALKSWIGQTVTLQCTSDGLPVPTITWKSPNGATLKEVTAYDSAVTEEMSNDEDFGDYNCTAMNGLTPSDSVTVKIQQIKEPGAPLFTSSDVDIQATSLTVKWSKPTDDGGSPITAYRVAILRAGNETKNENVTDPSRRTLSLGDLEKHTNYTVKLFARNFLFEGPPAVRTLKTKFEGIPAAAELVDLPSEVEVDEVTLKWNKPDNNGAAITQYTVYQRTVNENGTTGVWNKLKIITNVLVREYVVKLERAKEYEFIVTATNKFGEGLKELEKIKKVKVLGGVPGPVKLIDLPDEVPRTELTLQWTEPETNGAPITHYTVYQRIVNIDGTTDQMEPIVITNITDRKYDVKLEEGKEYEFLVTATNKYGEGAKDESSFQKVKVAASNNPETDGHSSDGIDTAIVAGAAAAGVLLAIGVIILILLWRRRKSSGQDGTSRDELGGGNMGEPDEGYASVSRAAVQSLGADGPSAAVNYAVVDSSKKRKNRQPAVSIEYAQVDPSRKAKKNKKKKPGDLDYAELGEFRPEHPPVASAQPAAGAAVPAANRRPPAYEHTEYADIAQFGIPQPDPTYANVSKKDDVVYSNVESM